MEDQDLGEVVFEHVHPAPRELVFECMTTPEHLAQFFGPPGISAPVELIEIDLRPGGVWNVTMVNDTTGEQYPNLGECVEVVAPSRLVFREPAVSGMQTAIEFIDLGDGTTRCVTTQTNVPAMFRSPEAQTGMYAAFGELDQYLATLT